MPRTQVWFDGHCLTDYFYITNLALPPAQRAVKTAAIAGRDGTVLTGVTLNALTISMQLNVIDGTKSERLELLDTLSGWLDVDEAKRLEFSFDSGKYYMAVPSKIGAHKRWRAADAFTGVTFICPDPVRFGESHTVSVSSGGSSTIDVGGTYPTNLNITANSAVRNSSTGYWGVSVDNQKVMKVATGSSSSRKVTIDTDTRTVKVSNVVSLPTLDSDWFDGITPGSHTVSSTLGTGAFTVSWVDRWV